MKVLPEQILTWLKSTFGQEKTDTGTDKKRTFRGVVAAMRIIYGFKGKKLSLHQSGKSKEQTRAEFIQNKLFFIPKYNTAITFIFFLNK